MRLKTMRTYRLLWFLALATIGVACTQQDPVGELYPGDFLFQDLDCGPLCDAIETVTEGVQGKDFSHCGMVVEVDDTLKVIEAIGDRVQLTSIADFFDRSGDSIEIQNISIGRVKKEYRVLLEDAVDYALGQVGQPYDEVFLLENGSWYCSELVYASFKAANADNDFFELSPMTYKDPETNAFFPAWVAYYKELGVAIPEGKPGLNPGSISRSEKIEIIYPTPNR